MHLISVEYFDKFVMLTFHVTETCSVQEQDMSLPYQTFLQYNFGVKHYEIVLPFLEIL